MKQRKHLKQYIRDMKIKNQFCLLLLTVIVIVLFIQGFYVRACLNYAYSQSKSYFDSLSGQIAGEINTQLMEVRDTASRMAYSDNIQQYLLTDDPYQRRALTNAARDVIGFGIAGNHAIQSVRIYQSPTSYLGYNANDTSLVVGDIFSQFDLEIGKQFAPFFSDAFLSRYPSGHYFAYIMPVYDILSSTQSNRSIGVLFALCTTDAFFALRSDSSLPDMGLYIFDQSNLLSHNGIEPPQELLDAVMDQGPGLQQHLISTSEGPLLLRTTPLAGTSFSLCCAFPRAVLTRGIEPVIARSLIFTCFGVLVIIGMSLIILSNTIKPIERMTAEMEQIGSQGSTTHLTAYAGNEVGRITSSINSMLDQLDGMHQEVLLGKERLYSLELTRVESELQFLHSQINPHFLYNSLECIRSIALINGQHDIVTMSVSLSRILRYSIQSEQVVQLSTELSHARDYFSVINIRNMNIHRLHISVDESLKNACVIKMLLQPLLENSFHAFWKDERKGFVYITVRPSGENIRICVYDNGCGMCAQECRQLNQQLRDRTLAAGNHIGLANIQKRIQLTYGEGYGLKVTSRQGVGTCVTILLPMVHCKV